MVHGSLKEAKCMAPSNQPTGKVVYHKVKKKKSRLSMPGFTATMWFIIGPGVCLWETTVIASP